MHAATRAVWSNLTRRASAVWLFAVLGGVLSVGCVERRFVVTTDPPGSLVLRNNERLGAAPADDHFVYYGNYHFTLSHDGYETVQIDEKIHAPWYQYPPLDFFAESLLPWTIYDVRHFHYQLQPLQAVRTDELLPHAETLRQRGQAIAPPDAVPVPAALPTAPPTSGTSLMPPAGDR